MSKNCFGENCYDNCSSDDSDRYVLAGLKGTGKTLASFIGLGGMINEVDKDRIRDAQRRMDTVNENAQLEISKAREKIRGDMYKSLTANIKSVQVSSEYYREIMQEEIDTLHYATIFIYVIVFGMYIFTLAKK